MTQIRPTRLHGKAYHWIPTDGVLRLFGCSDPLGTGRCVVCNGPMKAAS